VRVLVTGGAGFIGSHFVRLLLNWRKDVEVVNFDKLTYAGNAENVGEAAQDPRYKFVHGNIADAQAVDTLFQSGIDILVHFASETHVDRSIEDAAPFLQTNVLGTWCLLEAARRHKLRRFVHISSDEVYGSVPAGESRTEEARLTPSSPYAASKAAADHLVSAYAKTYGVQAVILRCTNNYGSHQFPEKLIPLLIANAVEGRSLPVYGDGLQERDWLHVEDNCRAIVAAMQGELASDIYNISAGIPLTNLEVARQILGCLGKPLSLIEHVQDRTGHDRRYAIDSSKLRRETGWTPTVRFEQGIRNAIDWYVANPLWLDRARSGEYLSYYERHYARRTATFSRKSRP
jgi:dTDP-glucose 4,6-dehydratase